MGTSATAAGLVLVLAGGAVAVAAPGAGPESSRPAAVSRATGPADLSGVAGQRAPRVLYTEDFENGVDRAPIMLTSYTGARGETYGGDPVWLNGAACNGIVMRHGAGAAFRCAHMPQLGTIVSGLGQIVGAPDPDANHAVSAYSNGDPGADKVQVTSLDPVTLPETDRFISFGVAGLAANCSLRSPLLDFSLVDGGTEQKIGDRPIDVCNHPDSETVTSHGVALRGGQYVSDGGLLFAGDSVRWVMRNAEGSGSGNDGAIDDVVVYDSTPQLEAAFDDSSRIVGDTARLTFRVVNTTENGKKPGWSFESALPPGLELAAAPDPRSTCSDPDVTAVPGGSTVSVEAGLGSGQPSCDISVQVTSTTPGTYAIDPAAFAAHTGIDLDPAASVTFAAERNALVLTDTPVVTGGNGDLVADLGEQVAFRYAVVNHGDVEVHDLDVVSGNGDVTCSGTSLAPGAAASCTTLPRTVTQADVDAGAVDDDATADALSRMGAPVSASASTRVATTPASVGIGLRVSTEVVAPEDGGAGDPGVGDEVGLRVSVQNEGNVSLRDIGVALDGEAGMTATCPATPLAPGASVACGVAGTHTVDQTDVDRGEIVFTTHTVGTGADGTTATAHAVATQPTVAQAPAVGVTITAEPRDSGRPAAGDTITPQVTVENHGNVTLTTVAVGGGHGVVSCPAAVLAPGERLDCSVVPRVLTQDDIDAGTVDFSAVATAVGPKAQHVSDSSATSVTIDRVATAAAVVGAQRRSAERPAAGEPVEITTTVENTGNTTLTGVALAIPGTETTCPATSLIPGDEMSCSVPHHLLSQEEIDHGSVEFLLAASATSPVGPVAASDETRVDLPRLSSVVTDIVAHLTDPEHTIPRPGDHVAVSFRLENTGNTSLADLETVVPHTRDARCGTDALVPGASVDCTVDDHVLSQDDIEDGHVTFTATTTGTGPEARVSSEDTVRVGLRASAGLDLQVDWSGADPDDVVRPGDALTATSTVTNTGSLTVNAVALTTEQDLSLEACDADALAPGDSTTCATRPRVVTEDDAEAGALQLALTAEGSVVRAPDDARERSDGSSRTAPTSAAAARVPVSSQTISHTFEVVRAPAPAKLAFTGSSALVAGGLGAGLLLAGAVLVMIRRRRRPSTD